MAYGEVKITNTFKFVHKVSKETHTFTRTLLSTWIREDGKRFTPNKLYQYYDEPAQPMPEQIQAALNALLSKKCTGECGQVRYPSYFYASTTVCKLCLSDRARVKREAHIAVVGRPPRRPYGSFRRTTATV